MMHERDVVLYLGERVFKMGGEMRRVRWIGRRGAPDLLVLLPGRSFWVEAKAPGEKPSPAQLREHARLRAAGNRVEIVESEASADEVLAR